MKSVRTFREFEKFCEKNRLQIFTIHDLAIFFQQSSAEYIRLKIYRWKEKGFIQGLKKGLYFFPDAQLDEFEISAKLVIPSYISLESALSHYSIIPDVSAQVTCITTKNTSHFSVGTIHYQYFHIQPRLFFGFLNFRNDISIASREKAILDYLYFRRPSKDDLFFERLNQKALKDISLSQIQKMAKFYPAFLEKSLTLLSHAFTS